jgi:hypothetical protein
MGGKVGSPTGYYSVIGDAVFLPLDLNISPA